MSKLVIVESPAKAKTIRKYLGDGFNVMASMGHIRDLPASQMGVDIEHGFAPQYISIQGKHQLVKELKSQAAVSEYVYLATDPDREGEAISWHLAHILGLDVEQENRVTFGEITKKGIQQGMANPRKIDKDLFYAQQARRLLDRIVGYKLSPFLWRKVRRGLSAGRVQSVAVRLLDDREREIESFVAEEYWNIDAVLSPGGTKKFNARFYGDLDGKKTAVLNAQQAEGIVKDLEGETFTVKDITTGNRKKQPAPPFITSTLQQEASRRLSFTSARTMRAAQMLYEGVDIKGSGTQGLITYMRTDSLRVSDEAVAAAKTYITDEFGADFVCGYKRVYKSKGAAHAQDAHEAVRPTNISITPDIAEQSISGDVAKLYRLIWSRFIASQMADALHETANVEIAAGKYLFKASGYTVLFKGYSILYEEAKDEKEEKETALPPLTKGAALKLREILHEQKFTQPPQRYTEATLIKELEENGIGRPSTYAPTISTIIDRGYVERDAKRLKPTELGRVVNGLMREQFANIVDVKFSAAMEKNLDKIEDGKAGWQKTLEEFYVGFDKALKTAEKNMDGKKLKVADEETDEICEVCGRKMVIKTGRFGKFLACPGFPECKNTKRIVKDTGGICPKCGARILTRQSKKGRTYYGCEKNPTCDFMTWNMPTAEKCETCGSTLFKKLGRNPQLLCEKEGCGFTKPLANAKTDEQ